MRCRKCSTPVTVAPISAAPSWADPMPIMGVSAWRSYEVQGIIATATAIAVADPKRIGIGFSCDAFAQAVAVHPIRHSAQYGFSTVKGGQSFVWFDLFHFGPLVNAEWWGFAANNGTIVVTEWYRIN